MPLDERRCMGDFISIENDALIPKSKSNDHMPYACYLELTPDASLL